MNNTGTTAPTWTQRDEQAFNEMLVRRNSVMEKRRDAVNKVASKIWSPSMAQIELIDGLIEMAEQVRDALAPYDSGCRAAEDKR